MAKVSARLVLAPVEIILTKLFKVISNTFLRIIIYVYRKIWKFFYKFNFTAIRNETSGLYLLPICYKIPLLIIITQLVKLKSFYF